MPEILTAAAAERLYDEMPASQYRATLADAQQAHYRAAQAIYDAAQGRDFRASDRRAFDAHTREVEALGRLFDGTDIDLDQILSSSGAPDMTDDTRSELRRTADTRLDALRRDGLLTDGAQQMVTRLMERGHQGERTLAQRWAAATSDKDYFSAFSKYCADPANVGAALTPAERHAYQVVREVRGWTEGTPASAGWLVPITIDASVMLSGAGVASPIRNVARVETIVGDRWRGISSAGTTAEWKAEATAANPVTPVVSVPEVPVHFLSVFTKFSLEIEQDGLSLVENLQEIQKDAAITKTETAYTTGTGVGEPQGLVTGLANVAASVVAPTTAEAFGKLDPIKIQNDLAPRFQRGASFLAALKILNEAAVMELSTGGSLVYPDVRNGRMLGRDVYELSTMDSAYDPAVAQAHNFLLAYGDWRKCFLIADRIGTSLEVIPHIFNSAGNPTGERGAWLYARLGSGVIMPEAGRLLDVPTT